MPPRSIYRWKSFWLGVSVIFFLAWAWRDSTHWSILAGYQQFGISHAGSGVALANFKRGDPHFLWFRQPIPSSDEIWGRPRMDAPEVFHGTDDPGPLVIYQEMLEGKIKVEANTAAERHFNGPVSGRIPGVRPAHRASAIFLPHWLLIVSFFIIWTAFLLWRWRKLRRLAIDPGTSPG